MAISVGKAEGKLTLDASGFISSITSAYSKLDKFNQLIERTQSALGSLSSGTDGGAIRLDTGNLDQVLDSNVPNSAGKSVTAINVLKDALETGLSGALKGVAALAKTTFDGFMAYTKQVAGFAKDSLNVGLSFDATMSKVQAITGATETEFDSLREKAIQMGAQTKFSATEAADAMVYMGMAGWKTQQVLDGISGVMSLAAASGEDLARTSDIVTDALTAFGLQADQASHFANVLAATATSSNTNVDMMGETFKYVASVAGSMGYNIEDISVAIGLMANRGTKASQAGTALRNILTNLAKPSKTVAQYMDELGISLYNSEGKMYSFRDLMLNLREAFNGLSPDMEEYANTVDGLTKSYDAGELSLEEYEKAVAKARENMLKPEEALKAEAASGIAGKYGMTGLLAIVNATDEEFDNLTKTIAYADTNVEQVSKTLENSGIDWTKYADKAWAAGDGIGSLTDDILYNMKVLGTESQDIQDYLHFEYNLDTTDAILAIKAVENALNNTDGSASEMEETMMNNLQGSIMVFQSTLETFKIRISDVLKGPANEFVNLGQKAIADMTEGIEKEGIPGLIKVASGILPQLINEVVKAIPDVLPPLIDGFWVLVNGVIDALPEALPLILDGAITLFMGLVTGLTTASDNLQEKLPGLLNIIKEKIIDNAPAILDASIKMFLSLVEGIAVALPDILEAVVGLIPQIVQAITDNLDRIIQVAIDLVMALVEGLTRPESISALIEGVIKLIDYIIKSFTDVDWLTVFSKIFKGIGDALMGVFKGALAEIDKYFGTNLSQWGEEVDEFFSGIEESLFNWGTSIAENMNKSEIELNELESKYSGAYQDMLQMYADLVKEGIDSQEAMAKAYKEYFSSAEAQYVFKERFAGAVTGTGTSGGLTGFNTMTPEQFVELLNRSTVTSGNTYNFYSPEPIDERVAADNIRATQKEILNG